MTIPKYIKEILNRSKYEYHLCTDNPNYAVGYTIKITKATPQTYAQTFSNEIFHLQSWVKKNFGDDTIYLLISPPTKTHYTEQFCVVTIFDPAMKLLEQYINN